MDLRSAPLRLVTKREKTGETLECGHQHQNTYRQAKRRRCQECLLNTQTIEAPQLVTTIDLDSPVSNEPWCAFCHDSLDNKVVSCSACRTVLHLDCSKELDRCPIFGCRGSFVKNSAPRSTNIVIRIKPPLWRRIVRLPYRVFQYIFWLFGKSFGS